MRSSPVSRGVLLAALAALAGACGARPLHHETDANGGAGGIGLAGTGGPAGLAGAGGADGLTGAGGGTFTPARKVDMLFVVDDSSETLRLQKNLLNNFPVFLTTLRGLSGTPPDMHIAVVSSDLGAGDGSIGHCDATGGDQGIFQHTARGTCTSTGLAAGATYIADNGAVSNYTGNLADVFACIAALGENGCGFEHQLAAITRALGADGMPPPEENQGFLRPDAFLFIMVVTNEDDCSAPPSGGFYDTTMNSNLASPLGPLGSYRCNEFGHLCNGVKPPRLAPNGSVGDTVTLTGCTSAEQAGMLTPVADITRQLRALKRFPDQQIVVAAVAGPLTPYTVKWHQPQTADTGPWPEMTHSCTASDLSWADPAVRVSQWVSGFGANGLFLSACDESFGPALDRLAQLLSQAP
ncbi:MAG TPA: hypothetical protein VIF57_06940 [Polyangia bacterium]|jgi:hypothetical protein